MRAGSGRVTPDCAVPGPEPACDEATLAALKGCVGIVGSRTFRNQRMLASTMDPLRAGIRLIVSGGAVGADRLGAKWARKNGIATRIFDPEHKRYRHAYHHRNRLIVEAVELLVAFWDGRSTGTEYTIGYARRMKRRVEVVRF